MTTIAYRDGIMAADSMLSDWGEIKRKTEKIFVFKDAVIGTAGEDGDILKFLEWWEAGHDPAKRPKRSTVKELHLIVALNTGVVEIWAEDYIGEPVLEEFCAIGSGRAVAYGALEMGATAKEAVRISCKWNTASALPVRAVDVRKSLGIKGKGTRCRKRKKTT